MRRVLLILWSIFAWSIVISVSLSIVLVCTILSPIWPFERIQGSWPGWIIGKLPYLTLSRISVTWDPAVDPDQTVVFVMNHVSSMDAYVAVHGLPHPFCGLLNASHLKIPGYGGIMRLANAIGVPKGKGRFEAVATAALERKARKISILTFPEAHRTRDGELRDFRTGAFFMARDAGMPIVPVSVSGLWHVLKRGEWIINPGHIQLHAGAPIPTDGLTDDEVRELAASTHAQIKSRLAAQANPSASSTAPAR